MSGNISGARGPGGTNIAIREIQAKTLLSHRKEADPWFGIKYTMNIYRGCQHQCIYCDSRSHCYQIEDFSDILIKTNALELLPRELASKRIKGTVGTGSMCDSYMPIEANYNLTGRALKIIAQHGFPVHIVTKGDLVTRDLDALVQINRIYAAVSFSITTTDDDLAAIVEPGAASPSRRFSAMAALAEAGIRTGVTLMPILPFIEDTLDNIQAIMRGAHEHGASYIIPAMGMTLREGQREYYYARLDEHFPGLRTRYEHQYGLRYEAAPLNARELYQELVTLCSQYQIEDHLEPFRPDTPAKQLSLL